jgi:LL-diaminopimelate aminotransferase
MNFSPADRIASFQSYYFGRLGETIQALRKQGRDIIRLDIGSPDLPPTCEIIETLYQSAKLPTTHGYTMHNGTQKFRNAVVTYLQNRFHIQLDPKSEILALIGSKEGLFNLSQAILNPGDIVLVPDPGYPVYEAAAKIAGVTVITMPLLKENEYLPDLQAIPQEIARKAKMLWLNYPNNPTGAIATQKFYREVIDFAHHNNILLASDAPYTDVCFDGYIADSILQMPGAKEVTVEFNSLSKTYNMAGWRVGFAAGNAQVLGYLKTYKSQQDSANFLPILEAGAYALTSDQTWLIERNEIYRERRDIILAGLKAIGLYPNIPKAALYVWSPIPKGFMDSTDFCERCLQEIGVSFAPGILYGNYGEGYFRISFGCSTQKIEEAMHRLRTWLLSQV